MKTEQLNKTPLLSLLYNVTNNVKLNHAFMENEEMVFDLFSVSEEDRNLLRESTDTHILATRITEELSQFSVPGKVMPAPDSSMKTAVIGLIYNLINNGTIWGKFKMDIENERSDKAYINCVFKSFNVDDMNMQKNITSLFEDKEAKHKEAAVDEICSKIKQELMGIL